MGCRAKRPPEELLRVTRGPDGTLEVGRSLPGRGAWLCRDISCLHQAERRKAFPRALRGELVDGAIEALRARMEADEEDGRA